MKSQLLHEVDGQRTFALVFQTDDEVIESLTAFARRAELKGSHFTAIGAFSRAVVAFFDWATKKYQHIEIAEQVEVLSLAGDITMKAGSPLVHAHVVLGQRDATAHGGHLIEAHVRPTLEVVLVESPAHLQRHVDEESGLPLIRSIEDGPRSRGSVRRKPDTTIHIGTRFVSHCHGIDRIRQGESCLTQLPTSCWSA